MSIPSEIYKPSLSLLTDLYQLTMAYGYWKLGRDKEEAAFHLFFRQNPFKGGYTVAAGLAHVIDYVSTLKFDQEDLEYLAGLQGNDGKVLFESAFIDYLGNLKFRCDVDGVPEGTVVFPQEPLLRVVGSILQCQLLETALLNMINFQSLIATKAARVCEATGGMPVLEFGLRRAQGIDGALAASRAAYIGGCAATSNVLAGRLLGIPVKGTHAHSWVMLFEEELESFNAYADVLPNNCVFLVDTYDTLEGVKNAITAGERLRARGYEMVGIRLDSGDLAYLSMEARKMLDEAGFPDAVIVASNDLDEKTIESLRDQGSQIGIWGVGTRLITGHDQPALGGVYKLAAVRKPGEPWEYKVKVSEQTIKVSTPGVLQIRRYEGDSGYMADMVYDVGLGISENSCIVDPMDSTRRRDVPENAKYEDLLVSVIRNGEVVYEVPPIKESRMRKTKQLEKLHPGIRRFLNPHEFPSGTEKQLFDLKTRLIMEARGVTR